MENNIENSYIIFDGNSIMNRTFYGIKLLTTKDGIYTNAIYGFLNIYYMMLEKLNPKYVAVAFDVNRPTFRHEMYSEYKAGRRSMPDELRPQMNMIKEILKAMNVLVIEDEGYEADDILGTIAKNNDNQNIPTYIITGDRDALQLISINTTVVIPHTQFGKTEYTYYTPEVLFEKYQIVPKQVIEVKALMGDSSDNIPGVPKIGEKTAYGLIHEFNNIDKLYKELDNNAYYEILKPAVKKSLIENKEKALLSKTLATINVNVPTGATLDKAKLVEPNFPELMQMFEHLEFKKFADKLSRNVSEVDTLTASAMTFYATLDKMQYHYIYESARLLKILLENQSKACAILYSGNKSTYDKLKDVLFIKIDTNIYVIPLCNLNNDIKKAILQTLCTSKIKKVGYDIKPFIRYCFENNITNFNGFDDDIMLEYYLTNSIETNYTLENISYNVLNISLPKLDKSIEEEIIANLFDMSEENNKSEEYKLSPMDEKYIFAVLNSIEQCQLKLKKLIVKENLTRLYKEVEIPLIITLAYMENVGMYVNVEHLKNFGDEIEGNITKLTQEIYALAGCEFNIKSPKQLGEMLFDKLQIPYPKKNKSSYSTEKEILESIENYEIIDKILEFRSLTKLKSTYIDGILPEIKTDGRVHTTFMQTVASTGRLSSTEPNLQNIPIKTELGGKIRECFEGQGDMVIVDADYSQIELRILAHISDDANLINSFNNKEDIHTITASQVFNVPIEEVTKSLRSKAKAVNFGIVYGISEYGLARNLKINRKTAATYINSYLQLYNGVGNYMKQVIEDGKKNGYVETLLHRIRPMPELKSANYMTKQFGERIAMNMPIQGSAADVIKLAMNQVYNEIQKNNLTARLIMQVHDELLVECPLSEVDKVQTILKQSMENIIKLKVPLEVDINVAKNWLDAK